MIPRATLPLVAALGVSCATTHAPAPRATTSGGERRVHSEHADACYLGSPGGTAPSTHPLATASGLNIVAEPPELYPRCRPAQAIGVPAVRYVGHVDLPNEPWAHGLSGVHWTGGGARFDVVQDNAYQGTGPWVISMDADDTLLHWSGRLRSDLSVAHYDSLEGITRWHGALIVSTDGDGPRTLPMEPHIFSPGLAPPDAPVVEVPVGMRAVSHNSGVESLSSTPDGRSLYFGLERPQQMQGRCEDFVRIARVEGAEQAVMFRYRPTFEGGGPDVGLDEMNALSHDTLLTLERGFTRGTGNTVRIFLVQLHPPVGTDAEGTAEKTLVLDLNDLPREGFDTPPSTGQHAHPGLGNYEGMALGPCLSDGTRSMVLVTDDNWDSSGPNAQVRRVLVLSVAWPE